MPQLADIFIGIIALTKLPDEDALHFGQQTNNTPGMEPGLIAKLCIRELAH